MLNNESLYKCVVCGVEFEGMHYLEARRATGRTIEHCGTVARWLRNLVPVDKDPRGTALDIIGHELAAAEMRQGCTDYGYYAEILLKQLEAPIYTYMARDYRRRQAAERTLRQQRHDSYLISQIRSANKAREETTNGTGN